MKGKVVFEDEGKPKALTGDIKEEDGYVIVDRGFREYKISRKIVLMIEYFKTEQDKVKQDDGFTTNRYR